MQLGSRHVACAWRPCERQPKGSYCENSVQRDRPEAEDQREWAARQHEWSENPGTRKIGQCRSEQATDYDDRPAAHPRDVSDCEYRNDDTEAPNGKATDERESQRAEN